MIKLTDLLKEVNTDIDNLYQNKKNINIDGIDYMFAQLNTYGEENVFIIELKGNEIGRATLNLQGNFLENIRINPEYRRKGLATKLYDYIESITRKPLNPSPIKQSPEIKQFWKKKSDL